MRKITILSERLNSTFLLTPSPPFRKLVIGRDDITPDEVNQGDDSTVYKLTWFTNGYAKNSKGQRHKLRFAFTFEGFELAHEFQVRGSGGDVCTRFRG